MDCDIFVQKQERGKERLILAARQRKLPLRHFPSPSRSLLLEDGEGSQLLRRPGRRVEEAGITYAILISGWKELKISEIGVQSGMSM